MKALPMAPTIVFDTIHGDSRSRGRTAGCQTLTVPCSADCTVPLYATKDSATAFAAAAARVGGYGSARVRDELGKSWCTGPAFRPSLASAPSQLP